MPSWIFVNFQVNFYKNWNSSGAACEATFQLFHFNFIIILPHTKIPTAIPHSPYNIEPGATGNHVPKVSF